MHSGTPRSHRPALVALALMLGAGRAPAQQSFSSDRDSRPNILVLVADDLGVDRVGIYNEHPDPGRTPVIDSLAERGVLFRNAWSNPTCSPTRSTLFTGRHGFRTGVGRVITYAGATFELNPYESSIARTLAGRYRTAVVGKWHLASQLGSGPQHPLLMGFEHHRGPLDNIHDPEDYYSFDKAVDGAIVHSTTYATTDQVDDALQLIGGFDSPWMVWLCFTAPHGPLQAPPANLHSYNLPPTVAANPALYSQAMTEAMDTEIGRLLDGLGPQVLARTVVIFVGDNGTAKDVVIAPSLASHAKATVFEGGVNVPLIVAGPGVVEGAECAALVQTTDFFATIAELAGAPYRGAEDSISMATYLHQPQVASRRDWVYAETFAPWGLGPKLAWHRAVRDVQGYKLMVHYGPSQTPTSMAFHDLIQDPGELNNLLAAGPLSPAEQAAFDRLWLVLRDLY